MAAQPPPGPLLQLAGGAPPAGGVPLDPAAAAAAAAFGGVMGQGGAPPGGMPPPPPGPPPPPQGGAMPPPASPGPTARAIWAKVPPEDRHRNSGEEMATYLALVNSNAPNPQGMHLAVATTSAEPICFLTSRQNSQDGVPKIQLITSIGTHVIGLNDTDELHGKSFAFVGEHQRA
jgi:hypothetical protein